MIHWHINELSLNVYKSERWMSATFHCQKANEVRRFTIRPIIYTISKIPQLPGTRSCSIGRTRNSNREDQPLVLAVRKRNTIRSTSSLHSRMVLWMNPDGGEERVQREERDWFESLEPLQGSMEPREKSVWSFFDRTMKLTARITSLVATSSCCSRVSMLLRHNSDTYRQDSSLACMLGGDEDGEEGGGWDERRRRKKFDVASQWASWMTSTEEEEFHRSYLCDLILRRGDTTMSRKQCDLTREECRLIRLTAMIGCILTLVRFPAFFAILMIETH